jgi:hypothetical protein
MRSPFASIFIRYLMHNLPWALRLQHNNRKQSQAAPRRPSLVPSFPNLIGSQRIAPSSAARVVSISFDSFSPPFSTPRLSGLRRPPLNVAVWV